MKNNLRFVVAGESELAGAVAVEIANQNLAVKIVAPPGSAASRVSGNSSVKIVEGVPTFPGVFQRADLTGASHLVLFPSDLMELFIQLSRSSEAYQPKRDGEPLRVFAALPNWTAANAIRSSALNFSAESKLRVQCFFPAEDAATDLMFQEFGRNASPGATPRFVLLGSDLVAEVVALKLGGLGEDIGGSKIEVDWIVPGTEFDRIRQRYPCLEETSQAKLHSWVTGTDWCQYIDLDQSNHWILVSSSDSESLETVLSVHDHLILQRFSRIYISASWSRAMSEFLRLHVQGLPAGGVMRFFGGVCELFSVDRFLEVGRFGIAKAIHAEYCQARLEQGDLPEENPSVKPWEQISQDLRRANFEQADHMLFKVNSLGFRLEPASPDSGKSSFSFTETEIESLARLEHARWLAERKFAGWKYDPMRNDSLKLHPSMVPYLELPESEKEKDREAVRIIPDVMRGAGLRLVR
jgi:hypothetical protein